MNLMESSESSSSSESEDINFGGADDELDKKFEITMKLLKSKDKSQIDKLKNIIDTEDTSAIEHKSHKNRHKPIYLKDYEVNLLLQNQEERCEPYEENNLIIANKPKPSLEEIEADNKIIDHIRLKSCEFFEDNDDFLIEKSDNDKSDSENIKNDLLLNLDEKKETDETNDLNFVQNYISSKKYLFAKDPSITAKKKIKKIDFEAKLKKNDEMNIAYPRSIESSSRIFKNPNRKKRKNYRENKLRKRCELFDNLKIARKEKKREIVERINAINNLSVAKKDQCPNHFLEDESKIEDYQDDIEENEPLDDYDYGDNDHSDENINNKLSKRKLKKLKRTEKVKKKISLDEIDPYRQCPDMIDEYYNLNYEDIIDDTPVRYNYKSVIPNSYGLTPEQILLCEDKELNKWCSMKKVVRNYDEDEEHKLQQMYKRRIKNKKIRLRVLTSLYESEIIKKQRQIVNPLIKIKSLKSSLTTNRTRLVKRFFKKAQTGIIENLPTERLLAYNLQNDKKFNNKISKSKQS